MCGHAMIRSFSSITLYIPSTCEPPFCTNDTHVFCFIFIFVLSCYHIFFGGKYIYCLARPRLSHIAKPAHPCIATFLLFFKYSLAVKLKLLNTFNNITHGSMSTFFVQGIVRVWIPPPSQLFDCADIYLGKVRL
jgi:hypothetical protein